MPLELKIVSEHADLVGDDALREFREDGGTIGRSLQNDWILPDPDRYISGRHATIDYKGGIYYLLDTSSNGVYVNDDVEPIGKGTPRRLFNGDKLRMGDFIFEVSVDAGESLVMPLESELEYKAISSNIELLVDEVSLKTGIKLLDEDEMSSEDIFESTLFGKDPEPVAASVPESSIERVAEPSPDAMFDDFEEVDRGNDEAPIEVTAEDLFDSFLDGLGLNRNDLVPGVNRPDMMMTAGVLLREFAEGTTDMITSRANFKSSFRLQQTTVLPRRNNPMKFSENTNDLLKQLLTGGEGDYLGARDSVREVNKDLLHHQNAFLDAMNSAFIEFADRFDPEELQDGFDRTMSDSKLLAFLNKTKYWQLYCDLYPIITEKGGGRFPLMFGEEFVKAYERQVADYRRHDRDGTGVRPVVADQVVDPGLMETRKLDNPPVEVHSEVVFEDSEIIETLTATGNAEIDQGFIDDLEISMAEQINPNKLKA